MKRKLTLLFGALMVTALALGLTACTTPKPAATDYQETITATRTAIWQAIGDGASSAAVAISDNGKIVYQEGFAMADRAAALPVDEDTQFNIGSISKMFVTMAVLQLCQDGQLDLDQPVSNYLPEFTMSDDRYLQITVRMLLNHSSALGGTHSYNTITTAPDPDYMDYFLSDLSQSTLKSDPGIISIYCNDGFTLAQALVEKVSGLSYADYLSQHILSKAGMNRTSCNLLDGDANVALNYGSDGLATGREYLNSLGAGGIASTATDLCRFGDAIQAGKIINPDFLDESFSPQYGPESVPSGTPQMAFGLGWDSVDDEVYQDLGVRLIYKGGDTSEYHAMLYLFPDQQLTIAVTFSGPANTTAVTDVIATTLLAEKGLTTAPAPAPTSRAQAAPIPDPLMAFGGYYSLSGNILKLELLPATGQLNLYSNSDTGFVLVDTAQYQTDGYFYGSDQRFTLEENYGSKFLITHSLTGVNGSVKATMIPTLATAIDPAQFVGKNWITINTLPNDTVLMAGSTGVMNEFPGYVVFGGNGYYLLNQLADQRSTTCNLKYTRDTMTYKLIDEGGQEMLQISSFKLINAATVPVLQNGETITIGSQNICRQLPQDGTITPGDGRIVVLSPTLAGIYDSLANGPEGTAVTAGCYVVFIGNEGDTIRYDYQV